MLDRIDMDVVEMGLEVALILDGMLPVAPLPDSLLSLSGPAVGSLADLLSLGQKRAREASLDQAYAGRVVEVVFGQGAEQMHMIRQHDLGVEHEWPSRLDVVDSPSIEVHDDRIGEDRGPLMRNQREEIGRSRDEYTAVAHAQPPY